MKKDISEDLGKSGRGALKSFFVKLASIRELTVFAVVLALGFGIALFSPYFLRLNNIMSIVRTLSTTTIMAIGMTMVIITGGIDLSVGSVLGLAGMFTAMSFSHNYPPILCVMLGLSAGLVCGFINGLLITAVNLPPFIATLGTMSICRGLIYVITRGNPLTPALADGYKFIGQGYIGVVPMPVVIMLILVVAFQFCMKQTRFGRYVYALGGNEQASRLSGVKTKRVKLQVYTIAGFLSAIAGVILYARMTSAEAAAGLGEEMNVIAATVIGGASMSGGSGSVIGALIGAVLIGVIKNGMVLLNINSYAQQAVTGIVILLAVGIDMFRQKKD